MFYIYNKGVLAIDSESATFKEKMNSTIGEPYSWTRTILPSLDFYQRRGLSFFSAAESIQLCFTSHPVVVVGVVCVVVDRCYQVFFDQEELLEIPCIYVFGHANCSGGDKKFV